jgi:hypothetical protein
MLAPRVWRPLLSTPTTVTLYCGPERTLHFTEVYGKQVNHALATGGAGTSCRQGTSSKGQRAHQGVWSQVGEQARSGVALEHLGRARLAGRLPDREHVLQDGRVQLVTPVCMVSLQPHQALPPIHGPE